MHTEKTIYGKGLVDAFDLENKVARHPRIMVTREVYREALTQHAWDRETATFLTWGDDGPFFIHLLKKMELVFSKALSKDQKRLMSREWTSWRNISRSASVDDSTHFEKVRWFEEYWNGCAEIYPYLVLQVKGRGLGGVA